MSAKIPALVADRVSERAKKALDAVVKFVEEDCIPADPVAEAQTGQGDARWTSHPSVISDLKAKAQSLGLWNMFLPRGFYDESPGFTNLEYALMAEWLGRSRIASEACNCSAPDTGNMEVLAKYGDAAQKKKWLEPLMNGELRSAFLMTEPGVGSSDARNIGLSAKQEGGEWVLNGDKWWSSGAGDPRCEVYIVMANTGGSDYTSHTVILVPASTPGIKINRMLNVYGYDDAPHGHGHITFSNVRVPISTSTVLGPGRGFEVIQGRLGPGRIHHAMRTIGAAERALDLMIARSIDPRKSTFGKKTLGEHGVIREWIARSRVEIDSARLTVLNAAVAIDDRGAKLSLTEIAEAKILVPTMALGVIDRAVQTYGAEGVCQDTPLANMWAQIRTLRLADGPDEVHLTQVGRNEAKRRAQGVIDVMDAQGVKTKELMAKYGINQAELQPGRGLVRGKL